MNLEIKYIVLDIETTGLNPVDDRITCICVKDSMGRERSFCHENEALILDNLFEYLGDFSNDFLIVTKNGKQFDLPFIATRTFFHKILTAEVRILLKNPQIDLQEFTKGRVKLDDMARLLGVENKSSSGIHAINMFEQKQYSDLISYCMQDVEVTKQCFFRMIDLDIIKGFGGKD